MTNITESTAEHIHVMREHWLKEQNFQWDSSEDQPENWNKEAALAQIKANVPEEFQ